MSLLLRGSNRQRRIGKNAKKREKLKCAKQSTLLAFVFFRVAELKSNLSHRRRWRSKTIRWCRWCKTNKLKHSTRIATFAVNYFYLVVFISLCRPRKMSLFLATMKDGDDDDDDDQLSNIISNWKLTAPNFISSNTMRVHLGCVRQFIGVICLVKLCSKISTHWQTSKRYALT